MKYKMTEEQHDTLMKACQPVRMMKVGTWPKSPQENANDAWATLGEELGFKPMTVQPDGSDSRCFTAEPID